MPDENEIRISPREVYDTLRRLETKVDLLQSQNSAVNALIQAQNETTRTALNDHETRIRTVESRFVGIAVASMTILLTGAAVVIWKVLTG